MHTIGLQSKSLILEARWFSSIVFAPDPTRCTKYSAWISIRTIFRQWTPRCVRNYQCREGSRCPMQQPLESWREARLATVWEELANFGINRDRAVRKGRTKHQTIQLKLNHVSDTQEVDRTCGGWNICWIEWRLECALMLKPERRFPLAELSVNIIPMRIEPISSSMGMPGIPSALIKAPTRSCQHHQTKGQVENTSMHKPKRYYITKIDVNTLERAGAKADLAYSACWKFHHSSNSDDHNTCTSRWVFSAWMKDKLMD